MSNGNGNGLKTTVIAALASGMVAGVGAPPLLVKIGINPFRSDPFTGSEATYMMQRITKLEEHVENHPDAALRAMISALEKSIATFGAKQEVIIKNQDRIIDKLDNR